MTREKLSPVIAHNQCVTWEALLPPKRNGNLRADISIRTDPLQHIGNFRGHVFSVFPETWVRTGASSLCRLIYGLGFVKKF